MIFDISYTSLNFLLFVAATMLFYFALPLKRQKWVVLLVASMFFYAVAGYKYAYFILFTSLSTYLIALWIEKISNDSKAALKKNKSEWDRNQKKAYKNKIKVQKRLVMTLALVLNFGILAAVKYYNFFAGSLNDVLGNFGMDFSAPMMQITMVLGISFYTFQSMGYIVDVYREKTPAQKNPFKLLLFVSFFPQIVQGPISIYDQLAEQLYEPHKFDFTRVKHGMELILWGFFKKLVIADRAVIVINAVSTPVGGNVSLSDAISHYSSYNGTTLTFIVLMWALQLYADFSHRPHRQLQASVLLKIYQRILAQMAHLARRVDEELRLLPHRHVECVPQRKQEDEGHALRQNRRGRSYIQGIAHKRSLAHSFPAGRYLARRRLEIRGVRRMERRYHHAKHHYAAAVRRRSR